MRQYQQKLRPLLALQQQPLLLAILLYFYYYNIFYYSYRIYGKCKDHNRLWINSTSSRTLYILLSYDQKSRELVLQVHVARTCDMHLLIQSRRVSPGWWCKEILGGTVGFVESLACVVRGRPERRGVSCRNRDMHRFWRDAVSL